MEIKEFAGFYYADGAMDEKTRQLVALAAMLASGCSTWAPARFAAAKQAGASQDEISETLYFAMRAGSRAVWTTIKNSIEGIEDQQNAVKKDYPAQK